MRRLSTIVLFCTSMLFAQEGQPAKSVPSPDKAKPKTAASSDYKKWLASDMKLGDTEHLAFKPLVDVPGPATAARLPVRRVVLYKNGVGYFEHTGRVSGSQQVGIDFTTAQLNDALKSLTVVDLGGGRITGVNYNSVAPLEQRLKTLRLPLGASLSREDYLSALRGAHVEVKNGAASATGRVLSIDARERTRDDKSTEQRYEIALVTDTGDMRTFELTPATSVRLLDRDLNGEVGRYMDLIASTRAEDLRRMTVSTAGAGERTLFVSYISEVPVWKSTYRIILPEKPSDKPRLQGWAIVDNTVGEDWTNVELSLVAGAPQSFVEDLSQPLYIRRPVVALPQTAQLTPQIHEGTVDDEKADKAANIGTGTTIGIRANPATPQANLPVNGRGFSNYAMLQPGVVGKAKDKSLSSVTSADVIKADALSFTTESLEAAATSQDLGDLFEYKLKDRVTIAKNQSALVPILSSDVDAEKVTLWHIGAQYPLRALWLTNSGGDTLDSGTFNIVDAGAFAGEGVLDHIKPGEKRLLSYAVDQGVRIDAKSDSNAERVSKWDPLESTCRHASLSIL